MTVANLPSETRIAAQQYTKERDYWLEKLSGEWEKSSFGCDHRKETGGKDREKFPFAVPGEVFEKLMKLSNGADDLLHMVLSAVLALLLNRYTGNSDIIIGTPIYKQNARKDFINTVLAIRNRLESHMTFKGLLVQVRQTVNEAVEHLNYPVEILPELLKLPVSPEEFPLFDVVISLENIHEESYISHTRPNMIFSFSRTDEGMTGQLEYNTALYRDDTAARIVTHFKHLLGRAMSGMDEPLSRIDILTAEEKEKILIEFNDTRTPYPDHKTIPQLFEEQVEKTPHSTALVYENRSITYKGLDERANRLANYLCEGNRVRPGDPVVLLQERSVLLIVSIMGILKAGGAYVPIDTSFPEERIKRMIDDTCAGIFVSQKKFIKTLNRLQWGCPSLHTVICIDSEDILSEEEEEKSELMSRKLWEYVGETASDDIAGGGWLSSYTGEPIPVEEMAEYGDNVLKKLLPLLHKDMRVLEIGCASGLSMYRVAPRVGLYCGSDLSSVIIRQNEERVREEGITNIKLSCLAAHEIDRIPEEDFDLVIINSVIQCFHGHNYLRGVLAKAVKKIKDKGWLFIGDVMNLDLQEALIKDLGEFKQTAREQGKTHYKTKLDWSAELFISPSFFKDLLYDIPGICRVEFSDKIHTIENELTKFRYDALFTIDKSGKSGTAEKRSGVRHKNQHDLRVLRKYGPDPVKTGLKPADLAYIIYTSGSTGVPKGTLTNHFNVIRVVKGTNYIGLTAGDNVLQLSNYAFDGSVFDIYGALLNGSKLVMMNAQEVFAADKLTALIRREKITVFFVTTALFNVLVDIDIECLKNIRKVLFGGEQVSLEHSRRALNYLGKNRIIHVYGPTETTVYATYYDINEIEEGQLTVPIGRPLANTVLYVLDKESRPVPVGVPGELVIGGDGVARGYLNRPELTHEKFLRSFFQKATPRRAAGGPTRVGSRLDIHENQSPVPLKGARAACYKTGDLVRWLPGGPPAGGPSKATCGGNIEFLGRIDKQVKIRGFRIELGEIEHRLSKHPDIKEAAVLVREDGGGENYLCAYIVPRADSQAGGSPGLSISELGEYLGRELPGFMVPSYFVETPGLPLTANGKIDKKALPEPGAAVGGGYIPPQNSIQRQLARIWSGILGIDQGRISIDANFFEIGGHSLKATVLMSRIHKEMHVKAQLSEIFKTPTIRELSELFKKAERKRYININPVEKREYYALSPGQKRLYLLHRMGAVYNMTAAWNLEGDLKKEALHETFRQLIRRHESLRTSFFMAASMPVQKIHDSNEVEFEPGYRESAESGGSETEIIKELTRPFDLSEAPLLRVGLIKIDPAKHILIIDMHHIVSDGTSLGIFAKEFSALYAGRPLYPLRLQYKDYSQWQVRESAGADMKRQEEYWLEQFASEVPVLNLPYDYPRPAFQDFSGGTVKFSIDSEETGALKRFAVAEDVTLYMVLLALFDVLPAKLSGNEDITVGSPTAGRSHLDLQSIIGMFVGTLAMRNYPVPGKTLTGYIKEVKECTLGAFENQDYPFENLVEKAAVNRDAGRNPLFDIMFALQNIDFPGIEMAGLKMTPYEYESRVAFFDLFLQCYEVQEELIFSLNYCTKLFKQETIERFIKYFKKIISLFIKNPRIKIAEIELITGEEKRQIANDFNNTRTGYPADKTICRLFEDQVEKTPGNMAITGPARFSLTYRELDRQVRHFARLLIEKGAGPGEITGIMTEPSPEMVIGIFAILKAGGTYLPIDPAYPQERIDYMLHDSAAKLLLTGSDLASGRGHHAAGEKAGGKLYNAPCLAYVIYTSGSTGVPKGVMVDHCSAVNILYALQDAYPVLPGDRYLLKTSFIFDVSVAELFGWFFAGGGLVIIGEKERKDPRKIFDKMVSEKITHVNFVPSLFNAFLEFLDRDNVYKLAALRYIFLAGEALSAHLVKKFRELGRDVILEDLYGPTEGTVYASGYSLSGWDGTGSIPIGRPMPNMELYILDKGNHLQPVGVPGELCITGAGVARGYLNQPELTHEKFLRSFFQKAAPRRAAGGKPTTWAGDKIYKTGDLSRWLPDGNIEFLGRIDHQVKIRGFRVELGEIEHCLLECGGIKEAVVTLQGEKKGDEYICAYIVAQNEAPPGEERDLPGYLRGHVSRTLPGYMVPSFFVQLDRIPLTAGDKIDRESLPEPGMHLKTNYTAPRNELEEKLVETWAQVLNIGKESAVGIDDNFFESGGHSLKGAILTAKIRKEFKVAVPLSEIFRRPTIRKLASYIKETAVTELPAIKAGEKKRYYVLSFNQRRLWFIHQRNPASPACNMPGLIELPHQVDGEALQKALAELIRRHESLRTGFKTVAGEPVQYIVPRVDEIPLREVDLSHLDEPGRAGKWEQEVTKESRLVFDINRMPLLRFLLIKSAERDYALMFNMHHIISDGWSLYLFKKELMYLYECFLGGRPVKPGILALRYTDFAEWQTRQVADGTVSGNAHRFWKEKMEQGIPRLELPGKVYEDSRDMRGAFYHFRIPGELRDKLKRLSRTGNTTLFMVMFTAFIIVLSRYANRKDIACFIISAGREHESLYPVIGFFVNSILFAGQLDEAIGFDELLARVHEDVMACFRYQDYPLEVVFEELRMRYPEIPVAFNMINIPGARESRKLKSFEPYHTVDAHDVKFDLEPYIIEYENAIDIRWAYKKSIIDAVTIESFVKNYVRLLEFFSTEPGKSYKDFKVSGKKRKFNRER